MSAKIIDLQEAVESDFNRKANRLLLAMPKEMRSRVIKSIKEQVRESLADQSSAKMEQK